MKRFPVFTFATGGADVYIDLGTANTLVATRTQGIVANEPSVIAYRDVGAGRKQLVAVGEAAKAKIGRTPENVVTALPLREGVIADMDATEIMLRYFLDKARPKSLPFIKPRVVISLPHGVTDVEKNAVRYAGLAAGAREVALIEEPVAAAIGAGLPIHAPIGNMVVDIGGGTTEVAVISLYGIVHCETIRLGGHAFDGAIVEYVRKQYGIFIGEPTAERIKIKIGSAMPGDYENTSTVRGMDSLTGLPRELVLTAHEVHRAINPVLNEIIAAVKRTVEQTPPELVPDILRDGVTLTGGGALIRYLDERLEQDTGLTAKIASDPLLAIARGGEAAIQEKSLLDRISV